MDSSASPEWHRNFPRCANDARSSAFIDYLFSRGYSRNTVSALWTRSGIGTRDGGAA
jgi:hypothetical protein